jgi:hypothetical protein
MSQDQPNNPFAVSLTPGTAQALKSMGRGGEVLTSQVHGKYYYAAYYGRLFSFNVTAQTVPVIAGTLASVFSLYNPPSSTVNLELVDFDVGLVLATTVVDTLGLYWQGPTLASKATLGTIGVLGTNWFAGAIGAGGGQGNPYTSFTHSGTPVRVDIVSQWGAVTATNDAPIHKDFDGKIVLAVGGVLSAAMTTAASTASGVDLAMRWMEPNIS